jgi:DNA-binding response OmpR family regulator
MERKNTAHDRKTLLKEVWETSPNLATRTVDTHIKRLRDKLGNARHLVRTINGIGYAFAEPEELSSDLED